ncbi:unnamed protein product [Protopolystoma xenopodis]|uniref:Uncharacterized protein n=1 Tax=Protopolystoma xenopodis TaxID=117903 RepID=A0A3S4ZSP5_9PLAT|nr:unnamed protein product [Protopolystoma xenopodis]
MRLQANPKPLRLTGTGLPASLWLLSPSHNLEQFLANGLPSLDEFEAKFTRLRNVSIRLGQISDNYIVGPLEVNTSKFKLAAKQLLGEHEMVFVRKCTELYVIQVVPIAATIDEFERVLSRTLGNLDDLAFAMEALHSFYRNEVNLDLEIAQAEEAAVKCKPMSISNWRVFWKATMFLIPPPTLVSTDATKAILYLLTVTRSADDVGVR